MYDDRWRLAEISDWGVETSMQSSTVSSHIIGLSLPPEPITTMSMKKPPGLSQDAIDHLQQEFFGCADKGAQGLVEGVKQECCICLESFLEGDRLTCLPCEHKFHSACLVPWVRTCGDCPYCREAITVSTSQTRWEEIVWVIRFRFSLLFSRLPVSSSTWKYSESLTYRWWFRIILRLCHGTVSHTNSRTFWWCGHFFPRLWIAWPIQRKRCIVCRCLLGTQLLGNLMESRAEFLPISVRRKGQSRKGHLWKSTILVVAVQ